MFKDELGCESACPEGSFLCQEGRCFRDSFRCDGDRDCIDGEDEVREEGVGVGGKCPTNL